MQKGLLTMSERMKLQTLYNTRDLGGMETADGHKIKKKCLIRSGQLYDAAKEDLELLQTYGVNQIIDLRTDQEVQEKPDPTLEGVKQIHLPILTDMTQGITREEQTEFSSVHEMYAKLAEDPSAIINYMTLTYTQFVTNSHSLAQYAEFLNCVLKNESGATLWHCAGGKDRAGFASVLILECLGVSRDVIMEDYLFTNECLKPEIEQVLEGLKKQQDIPGLEEAVKAMFGARREYMEGIYQTIEDTYGNFRIFLSQALGMDENRIAKMREQFLED